MKKNSQAQIEESICELLGEREEVRFAYLFGSRVEGVSRPSSDLDLAVYLDEDHLSKRDPLYETRLSLEIEKAIAEMFEVDIVVFNHSSLVLKYQVTKKGKLVHYKDEAEARDFEALIRKKYFDFYPMRKEYNEERLNRYGVSR